MRFGNLLDTALVDAGCIYVGGISVPITKTSHIVRRRELAALSRLDLSLDRSVDRLEPGSVGDDRSPLGRLDRPHAYELDRSSSAIDGPQQQR